jgi:hypothetical protein
MAVVPWHMIGLKTYTKQMILHVLTEMFQETDFLGQKFWMVVDEETFATKSTPC